MENLEEFLSVALLVPMGDEADPSNPKCIMGLPVMLQGPPGVGKSKRVMATAKALGLESRVIFVPTRNPEDFAGLPLPDGKGDVKMVCSLPAVRQLRKIGRGVCFIDEISGASRAVQNAMFGFVLDRAVGDDEMPPAVRIIAAANGIEEGGNFEVVEPLANRFAWVRVERPSGAEYANYRLKGPKKLAPLTDGEDRVKKGWASAWAKVQGLGAAFSLAKPDAIYCLPPEGHPDRHRAWASPRSIDYMLRAAATCEALGKPELQFEFAKACVGEAVAVQWAAFVTENDLPDPRVMLTKGWTASSRLDLTFAALGAMTSFVKDYPAGKERDAFAHKAWQILSETSSQGMADAVVVPSGVLLNEGYSFLDGDAKLRAAAGPAMKKMNQLGLTQKAG